MSHVKFNAIPESWTVTEFLDAISKKLNWNQDEFVNIKLVHTQKLWNNRYHLRMSFTNNNMLNKIIKIGRATTNTNVYSLKLLELSILFKIMDNTIERFKLNKLRNNVKDHILLAKLKNDSTIVDLMLKIGDEMNINNINYISSEKGKSFISFSNASDKTDAFLKLNEICTNMKNSETGLTLIKADRQTFVNRIHDPRKKNNEHKRNLKFLKQKTQARHQQESHHFKRRILNNYVEEKKEKSDFVDMKNHLKEMTATLKRVVDSQQQNNVSNQLTSFHSPSASIQSASHNMNSSFSRLNHHLDGPYNVSGCNSGRIIHYEQPQCMCDGGRRRMYSHQCHFY